MWSKSITKLIPNSNKDTYLGYLRKNFEPRFLCSSLCSQPRDNLPREDWQMSLSFTYLTRKKTPEVSQIYQRNSGFTTQLWYRFIRSPQSKETSSHDISSKVPKSSVLSSWKDYKMHHSLLVLPQILGNTGFSELLDAAFVSHVFTDTSVSNSTTCLIFSST